MVRTTFLVSFVAVLGAAGCAHAVSGDAGAPPADVLVCGDNPTPKERLVFIALPDPSVEPGGMPFVNKPVVQACAVDTIAWFGPEDFTIEFDVGGGSPLERIPDQAMTQMEQQGIDFPSNGKGKVKLKVRSDAEKDKPYKYSVIVPGHTPLDPQVIIRQ